MSESTGDEFFDEDEAYRANLEIEVKSKFDQMSRTPNFICTLTFDSIQGERREIVSGEQKETRQAAIDSAFEMGRSLRNFMKPGVWT